MKARGHYQTGATLRHVGLARDGAGIDMDELRSVVNKKTALIATAHVSNVLGCELPVGDVVELARANGAKVLLDACQSVPHMKVDVQALVGCRRLHPITSHHCVRVCVCVGDPVLVASAAWCQPANLRTIH